MDVKMMRIAEKKVRQLGGDVCGVLVRKDGRLAAVDEHGRVQWLQDGQGAEPVGFVQGGGLEQLSKGHPAKIYPKNVTPSPLEPHTLVYTRPQPAQQGSVPEDVIRQCEDAIQYASEIRGGCISGVREAQKRVRAILDTPQTAVPEEWREVLAGCVTCFNCPEWSDKCEEYERRARELLSNPTTPQADGWVSCEDRLPTYRDSDEYGDVWVMSKLYGVKKMAWPSVRADFESHWMPTGLKRPQPPQEGEGDEQV